MNCPKCGKEMRCGYLVGFHQRRPLFWMPEDVKVKPRIVIDSSDIKEKYKAKGGYLVIDNIPTYWPYWIGDQKIDAWYCPDCTYVVFDASKGYDVLSFRNRDK